MVFAEVRASPSRIVAIGFAPPRSAGARVMTWVCRATPRFPRPPGRADQPAAGARHRTLTDITNENGSTPGKAFVTPGGGTGRAPGAGPLAGAAGRLAASAEVMQRQKQMQMMLDNSLSPAEFKTMVSRLRAESH